MASPKTLEEQKNYTFNPSTQKYIFHTKSKFGKNHVLTSEAVNTIVRMYSNYDKNPATCGSISLKLKIPKQIVEFVLKALGKTHDSVPYTVEVMDGAEEDDLVEDMMTNKSFNILQKFEKADWKKTQEDAEKWRSFEIRKLDPFKAFLESWNPPVQKAATKSKVLSSKSDRTFVIGLSDLHFGSKANARYMFNRPDWDTKKTVEAVNKYADEIEWEILDRKTKFGKCIILGLGDLIHSVSGKTARGTELIYDVIKEEQFDYALNSLLTFTQRMVDLFGKVEVHDVGGNHHYELDMALFRALDMYFKTDKRIEFTHLSSRPGAFKTGNTLFLLDHGADSKERVYVPSGAKLEKHVQSILLNNANLLNGTKSVLFCQGDKHHFEHLEFGTFEFIMFGTMLGSDEHANVNNWHNRARQACLVIDNSGLREIVHVYFD